LVVVVEDLNIRQIPWNHNAPYNAEFLAHNQPDLERITDVPLTIQKQRRSSLRLVTSDATNISCLCTPIAVTLTTQPVNSARRMMMT
jgi:hypothetical protein